MADRRGLARLPTPLLVAAGGAAGALARTGLTALVPGPTAWPTMVANLSGAFALGVVLHGDSGPRTRALLGTGFLGAWTTFSGLTLPDVGAGGLHIQLGTIVATVLLGLAAFRGGRRLATAPPWTQP